MVREHSKTLKLFDIMDGSEGSTSIVEKRETDLHLEQLLSLYKELMYDGTDSDRVKATMKLAKGYCSHLPRDMSSCIIPILVEGLHAADRPTEPQRAVQIAAVYCLKCIASNGDGTLANEIGHSGAIEHVLRLLPTTSDDTLRLLLVKFLWILVSLGDECRVVLARNGGLEEVVEMLINHGSDLRLERYLLEILSALSMLKDVRKELVQAGGLRLLIQATRVGSVASRGRACRAIGLLGISKTMRQVLSKRGAIPALVELFHAGDIETKLVAANSLGVISAHTNSIRPAGQAGAVDVFAELLLGPESLGREIAEDAFCVLAVAEPNAVEIANHMVRVLEEGNDEAMASAADVLWDIAVYRHRAPILQNCGAIPILIELLRDQGGQPEVRERVCNLVSRLCYEKRYRDVIANIKAIPLLADIVDHDDESEDVKQSAAEVLLCLQEDPDHSDKVSGAMDVASLRHVEKLLVEIHKADEAMDRSLRRMRSRFIREPDFI